MITVDKDVRVEDRQLVYESFKYETITDIFEICGKKVKSIICSIENGSTVSVFYFLINSK